MDKPVEAGTIATEVFCGSVSAETVLRYARLGLIPSIRIGPRGPVLFLPEDVIAALRSMSRHRHGFTHADGCG